MMEVRLRYGLNPQQREACLQFDGNDSPLRVLNGAPGYINLLDAFNAWQLVKELKEATGKPGAASFKHVSPAGAAIAGELTGAFRRSQMLASEEFSPLAAAYARARGGDRMCAFGDFVAVSDPVDLSLARMLRREVSDAYLPFRDNIDRAYLSGVQYVLHAGGSLRDEEVTAAVDEYGMVMLHSGMRWFQH